MQRVGALAFAALLLGLPAAVSAATSSSTDPHAHTVLPLSACGLLKTGTQQLRTPARPGLHAVRVSPRKIVVEWRLKPPKAQCKPRLIVIGVVATHDVRATAATKTILIAGKLSGRATLSYCQCYKPPNVGFATTYTALGLASQAARVLISR